MQLVGEVTLGNLLTIATLIGIAVAFGNKLGRFEETLTTHANILRQHSERFDAYERRLVEVMSDLNRVIGRIEGTQLRIDRNAAGRRG